MCHYLANLLDNDRCRCLPRRAHLRPHGPTFDLTPSQINRGLFTHQRIDNIIIWFSTFCRKRGTKVRDTPYSWQTQGGTLATDDLSPTFDLTPSQLNRGPEVPATPRGLVWPRVKPTPSSQATIRTTSSYLKGIIYHDFTRYYSVDMEIFFLTL